jgi:hypothetical protein
MTATKRGPFVLAGHNLGNVMGQGQTYRFFHGDDFKHSLAFLLGF